MSNRTKHQVVAVVKLILKAGKATPAYPVGPTLGGYGVNIGAFVREYNDSTAHLAGMNVPAEITINADRSFSVRILEPTTASLLRRAAGIDKGAATAGRIVAGTITAAQLYAIARQKMAELNALDLDGAARTIAGTARAMGIAIVGDTRHNGA
jgi:large subunit ribosomal protein L11